MAREVLFLIGADETVLWEESSESAIALPDARERWEAIWSRRDVLVAIVHSHPVGPSAFSVEDETTMAAVERALGRPLRWLVLSPHGLRARAEAVADDEIVTPDPPWADRLRRASRMEDGGGEP